MTGRQKSSDVIVHVKGRNMVVTDAIRERAVQKVGHLDRYLDRLTEVDVLLCVEHAGHPNERNVAEASARVKGKLIHAQVTDADMYAAIDALVDKLHHQLTRHKERTRRHKGGGVGATTDAALAAIVAEPALDDVDGPETETPAEGLIVRRKQFTLKPMFADDAAEELEALGHTFFVFLNAETEQVSVIYRRRDSTYGLIEPAFE